MLVEKGQDMGEGGWLYGSLTNSKQFLIPNFLFQYIFVYWLQIATELMKDTIDSKVLQKRAQIIKCK